MLVKNLFMRDNVECPDWLSNEIIDDDWEFSVYSNENDKHIWKHTTPLKKVRLTYDGNSFIFEALDGNGEVLLSEIITQDYVISE
jgi:hypothetical protein